MDILPQYSFRRSGLLQWALLCVALTTLGIMLAVWFALESARVTDTEKERLDALSKILVKDVTVNLAAVDNALSGIIRDRIDVATPIDRAALATRLRALVEAMPEVRGIVVLDAAANVVAAVPNDLVGRNFSQRSYFTVPRQRGESGMLYLTPPFRSVRGDIVMNATRILSGAGRFEGVVTAVLDPAYFADILHTALYAPDLHAAIVHSSGGVFVGVGAQAHPDPTRPQLGASATLVPAGLRTDSAIGLELRRDRALVHASLKRQAQAFAALFGTLGLICAGVLAWVQGRRRRMRDGEQERVRELAQSEALRASEARFRTLIEEAPVAVAMSRQGHFIYTNRRYNLLHGYAADEDLTDLPWRAMIAPSSLCTLQEQQANLDMDAPTEQRFEAIGLGHGNIEIPVFKATARVMLVDGPASLIFVHDIRAQKTAESNLLEARDAAEAANRGKAEFLANMSHEIRTPLNAILGMAYLLERSNRDTGAAAMLHKIRSAGRSLLGIINDILDVSKIEAGAMEIERNWFPLQDVIDTVAAAMGVAVGDKPIGLVIQPLPPAAAHVLGDALRIEQLLANLTSNAIKFTESGRIDVRVTVQVLDNDDTELLFRVTDTGIGIGADQQELIFSPFTQADSSTTRRFGGTGLGLTICKKIVALMDGRIGVDSTPGVGSTFWFALPLPFRPAADSSSSPEMVGLEVMIVSGDAPTHGVLADTARALGWRVMGVGSVVQALEGMRKPPGAGLPSVFILDWQLGADSCLSTARAIRADAAADTSAIVILISTYQAAAFDTDQARDLADALLTTPLTASTMYNAVIEARRIRSTRDGVLLLHPVARQALPGIRILVVDDSGINRDVAERILVEEGAQVFLAEHGRAAVDWLLAHPGGIDLVLMDVQMPVMDGIEATRILRSMAQFTALPIVALTAGAFSSHQEAARDAGMNHFIAKPFDIPLTIDLIQRMTGAPSDASEPATDRVAAPDIALPVGPLDVRSGLRIWGARDNYQRYLRKFAAAYGDIAPRMLRDGADHSTAVTDAAHRLAGAAANVALPCVTDLARRLERMSGQDNARPALIAELDVAMGAALDAIADYAPAPAALAAPIVTRPADVALAPLLERMLAALDEGMPEPALDALTKLAPHFAPAQLAPIAACIDDFDWPGAARHIHAIASGGDPVLAGAP